MERCCAGGPVWRRLVRRFSVAAGSILPGAALVLLPKCPMCLAVWLTAATGIGISEAGAVWGRGALVVFWMAGVAIAVAMFVRRRMPVGRAGGRCHGEKMPAVRP
jgi:hypothetical protein